MSSFSKNLQMPNTMADGEWWISNGVGGWASGTICGANTRKYHGMLIASDNSLHRTLLVPKLEEFAIVAQRRIALSTNFYPNAVHPDGYKNIIDFSFDGAVARWAFDALGTRISKEVWCEKGKNISYARYTLLEGRQAGIEILPFVNARDVNAIGLNESVAQAGNIRFFEQGIRFQTPFAFEISTDKGICAPAPDIYHNFEYLLEREREENYIEDLFMPAKFGALLHEGGHITIRMGEASGMNDKNNRLQYAEPEIATKRADALLEMFIRQNEGLELNFAQGLVRASDAFVLAKNGQYGIDAGFPYFGEWGRDTMISIPGICTCTGRHALGIQIIDRWMAHLKNGILPNRFDESRRAAYESADAFLWMVWAISQMQENKGVEMDVLEKWMKIVRKGIANWIEGNEFVFVDDDALASLKGERLTWMDAQVDNRAVTPRAGKRIEINALWVHALSSYLHWGNLLGKQKDDEIARLHKKAKRSMAKFYSAKKGYFFDGVEKDDDSFRPNQIWALALDACLIGKQSQKKAIEKIEQKLLVPGYGLRTLAMDDEKYVDTYSGSMRKRDLAYHQGTIWPWMFGAYAQAVANVCPEKIGKTKMDISRDLNMIKAGAILSVPEVYDPKTLSAGGCPAQAWSVAECLRAEILLERAAKERKDVESGKTKRMNRAKIANV
ncbi:MAG: amylo-alpha-1,6-glucosidase [Candidatus Micrarchaeia archaeon]